MEGHLLNTRYGIDEENVASLVEDAKDFAMFKGIAMRTNDLIEDARVPVPFCLVPSAFPKKWFDKACELQPYLNYVLHAVSYCPEFIKECLSSTIEVDEFTRNIYKIYEATRKDEQLSLGLFRSDYLLNSDSDGKISGIKQVENNTIASSFGGLAPIVKELHEFVLEKLGQKGYSDKLPSNESTFMLAKGITQAWDAYNNTSAIVLFVVEKVTNNICDQRALEYAVVDYDKDIKILRCSFEDLRSTAILKERTLFIKDREVAVVYYRVGYMPEHYKPEDWETRLLIERSTAIKCPSAGLQLAGTKTVQLHLSLPGVLEKFVDRDIAKKLRKVFVGQYTLDEDQNGDSAVSKAMQNPQNFVLKPNREGGGNNFYGEDIKRFIENTNSAEERKSYILMEHINSPLIPNCIVWRGKAPQVTNIICELGIFGTILGNKAEIEFNNFAGHLLRSKRADSNEVGINAGFGGLDSPYLE
ncbi:hypothetical protein JTE90_000549 [Oedothorax gibbosus]|uniref:Glutathione synthetase n=1 Tax=Oedothorax gibbosus TaxID=931172 RepID=A0AAV6VXL2_9ARAC|nr:hypothetical protein JTE90_000549 [Oedothorax gibbosus]